MALLFLYKNLAQYCWENAETAHLKTALYYPFSGHIKTAEQRTIIQQYGDWYTGRWGVGCYIWYIEEPGCAAAPPSPFLTVPNATAHLLTASVRTHIIQCGTIITLHSKGLSSYKMSLLTTGWQHILNLSFIFAFQFLHDCVFGDYFIYFVVVLFCEN